MLRAFLKERCNLNDERETLFLKNSCMASVRLLFKQPMFSTIWRSWVFSSGLDGM